jgi:hypothetical protein
VLGRIRSRRELVRSIRDPIVPKATQNTLDDLREPHASGASRRCAVFGRKHSRQPGPDDPQAGQGRRRAPGAPVRHPRAGVEGRRAGERLPIVRGDPRYRPSAAGAPPGRRPEAAHDGSAVRSARRRGRGFRGARDEFRERRRARRTRETASTAREALRRPAGARLARGRPRFSEHPQGPGDHAAGVPRARHRAAEAGGRAGPGERRGVGAAREGLPRDRSAPGCGGRLREGARAPAGEPGRAERPLALAGEGGGEVLVGGRHDSSLREAGGSRILTPEIEREPCTRSSVTRACSAAWLRSRARAAPHPRASTSSSARLTIVRERREGMRSTHARTSLRRKRRGSSTSGNEANSRPRVGER